MKRIAEIKAKKVTEKYILTEDALRSILRGKLDAPSGAKIEITFTVPGGGDYSGMELELDYSTPYLPELGKNPPNGLLITVTYEQS